MAEGNDSGCSREMAYGYVGEVLFVVMEVVLVLKNQSVETVRQPILLA